MKADKKIRLCEQSLRPRGSGV